MDPEELPEGPCPRCGRPLQFHAVEFDRQGRPRGVLCPAIAETDLPAYTRYCRDCLHRWQFHLLMTEGPGPWVYQCFSWKYAIDSAGPRRESACRCTGPNRAAPMSELLR